MQEPRDAEGLIGQIDAAHRRISAAQRELFRLIADVDGRQGWRDEGARDMACWLAIRYGISEWKARRWVAAAHALDALPRIAEAFASGVLGIDKVVELTRFATPGTEAKLTRWAGRVSCGCIRRMGDLAARQAIDQVQQAERDRHLAWWYSEDGFRFGMQAELPAAQGAVVARALERLAQDLPVMPGEGDASYVDARRADALVMMCSARIGADPDPDRATVVVHARLDGLLDGSGGCQIQGGPVIHPETA